MCYESSVRHQSRLQRNETLNCNEGTAADCLPVSPVPHPIPVCIPPTSLPACPRFLLPSSSPFFVCSYCHRPTDFRNAQPNPARRSTGGSLSTGPAPGSPHPALSLKGRGGMRDPSTVSG